MTTQKQFLVFGAPRLKNRGRWVEPIASINKPSDLLKIFAKASFIPPYEGEDFHHAPTNTTVSDIAYVQIVDTQSTAAAYIDIRVNHQELAKSLIQLDASMLRKQPRFMVQYIGRDYMVDSTGRKDGDPPIAGKDFESTVLNLEYVANPEALYKQLADIMHRPHQALNRKNYTLVGDSHGDGIAMAVTGTNTFELFQFLDQRLEGERVVYTNTRTVFAVKIIDLDNESNWYEFLKIDTGYDLASISGMIADFSSRLNLQADLSKDAS